MVEMLKKNKYWIGIVCIFVIKMILTSVQTPLYIYTAANDDWHILSMATNMLNLNWLGEYTSITLSKGIFASCFIAFANIIGIPLLMAEHLFYAGACLLFVNILRKVIKNDFISIILFAIMIFNPVTYSVQLLRIYRDYINASLLLYLVASLFGIFLNYREKWTVQIKYMILLGLAFTAMYICREEAIWVLPVIFAATLVTVLFILLDKECKEKLKKLLLYIIPSSIFGIIIITICIINYNVYGLFTLNQYSGKDWNEFIEAISSVKTEKEYSRVSLTKEARLKIYEVSPTFSKLKPYLEGDIGDFWATHGEIDGEIEDGWLSWALFASVDAAGFYENAKKSQEFYKNVTQEINEAYNNKILEKNKKNLYTPESMTLLFENIHKSYVHVTKVASNVIRNSVDTMQEEYNLSQEHVDEFKEVTGEIATNTLTYNYVADKVKIKSLEQILKLYKKVSPHLFNIAIISYAFGLVIMIYKKTRFKNYKEMLFLTAILTLFILRLIVIAYTETFKFEGAISTMYLSPTYSLQFAFEILAPWFLISTLYNQMRTTKAKIEKLEEK